MSSEIDAWIISNDLGISYQKFSNELKKTLCLAKFRQCENQR